MAIMPCLLQNTPAVRHANLPVRKKPTQDLVNR
jgi:hypothetical protein